MEGSEIIKKGKNNLNNGTAYLLYDTAMAHVPQKHFISPAKFLTKICNFCFNLLDILYFSLIFVDINLNFNDFNS
jgi:hypothetical protein